MRIAINTRFLLSAKMEGFGWFTYETVKRMVQAHPEHEFIFFFDRTFDEKFIFSDNVTPVVLSPQARHPILFRIWFNISVTKALKKYKADIFFSPDGYLSLKTNVPQVAVIHDLNFEHYPEDTPVQARKYLRKFFPLFAQKATHIVTVSEFSKQDIVDTYKIVPEKITVAHNGGSDAFHPLSEIERNAAKKQYANGSDYFVFVGALHPRKNLIRLFKAFASMKHQTQSSTQLVIVGEKLWKENTIEQAYFNHPFKDEIHFTGHLSFENLTHVVGGAKSLVFPSYFEGFGIPLVEAMKAGTAVICGNKTALPEVAGDAGMYFDPFNSAEIAKVMIRIDQDKDLREDLRKKGLERAKKFSWDNSAEIIWNVVHSVLSKSVD